jgi:hypothetical protein
MNVLAPKLEDTYETARLAPGPADRPYRESTLAEINGHKYPLHDSRTPWLSGLDTAGLVLAVAITLGPLAAYAVGLGA